MTARPDGAGLAYGGGALACEGCFSLLALPLSPKLRPAPGIGLRCGDRGSGAPAPSEVLGTAAVVAGIFIGFGWPALRRNHRPRAQARAWSSEHQREGSVARHGAPSSVEGPGQHGNGAHLVVQD